MNNTLHNYIDHYRRDAEQFDYFQVDNPSIREEERRRMELITHQMKMKSGQLVLDAGSGNGWVTRALLPRGVLVCAADLSLRNLTEIRKRFDPDKSGSYVVADLYHLPFKKASFDAATSNDVYEHLERPDDAAAELRRIMKKGAAAFMSVPYKENILYFLCIHCNKPTPVNAHLHSFDEKKLGSLFEGQRFHVERVTRFMNKGMAWLQVYYLLCRWMPFWLWRTIDVVANAVLRKPGRMAMKLVAMEETR